MDLILFNRTNENIEVTYLTKKNNSYRNNIKELVPGAYTITDIVAGSNVKIKVFSIKLQSSSCTMMLSRYRRICFYGNSNGF